MRLIDVPTVATTEVEIPVELSRLRDVIYNLWWSWSPEAHRLFHRIDPDRWTRYHNPVELVLGLEPHRWKQLLDDAEFLDSYHAVVERLDAYLDPSTKTWFDRAHPDFVGGPVTYFSTEYGWHDSIGIYSGGLGVLSGDHCKSASDAGLPFVGVGLMYRRGYFLQTIDPDGYQQHFYPDFDLDRLPLRPVADAEGKELHVGVDLPGREVRIRAWKAQIGRIPVLLLDSDIEDNERGDRAITSILYVQGREMRLCQELLLGVGGVRLLRALGIRPSTWHMNEGHSALLSLERIAERIDADRVGFDVALKRTRGNVVFTTHTPVPAGNENFEPELMRSYLAQWSDRCGVGVPDLLAMGEAQPGSDDRRFNLTALAMRTASAMNGVSELHGRVADRMWRHLATDVPRDRRAVGHVTNGVHTGTWIGPELGELLRRHLGDDWLDHQLDADFEDRVLAIPDREIWDAHCAQKRRLVAFARMRILEQFARHGRSPGELEAAGHLLDPSHLLIGFARRFATYKRAALIFRDLERLKHIVANDDRPVQILFAGKAHPADRPGQDLIRKICTTALAPDLKGRILFLENYNMRIARYLVQGVDLWLNNPVRPQEASGTSGMKVAVNGGLNCSVLDGWWCEGYDPEHGWAIGPDEHEGSGDAVDDRDAGSLYHVLEDGVVPCFYDRDTADGLPTKWIARMKLAIAKLTSQFSTERMVREYTDRYYMPASERQGWGSEYDEVRLWSS